jgi:single-stranded-DNA-specific exonuclease
MTFKDHLLAYYHLSEEEYETLIKPVDIKDLPRAQDFSILEEVASHLHLFIQQKKKIIIYGDYDADGMISTSILKAMFNDLHYHVDTYIPNRYQDGYGLNMIQAKRIVDAHYDVVITIDNGISAFEPILYLKKAGLFVLVIDHHDLGELPEANLIFHPLLQTSKPHHRCAGYLAYLVYVATLKNHHRYLLSLASIATLADAMPLTMDNRTLVRLGLSMMNEDHYPSISSLIKTYPVDENAISMQVIPAFNALGRMLNDYSIQDIVRYLLTQSDVENQQLSQWIKQVNAERKVLSQQWIETYKHLNDKVIILYIEERSGLTGLIANRLLENNSHVVAIFSPDSKNSDHIIGSIRANEGYELMEMIRLYPGPIVAFGGHPGAVGLTIKKSEFDVFKSTFPTLVETHPHRYEAEETIAITSKDIIQEHVTLVENLKPFGQNFPAPLFKIDHVPTDKCVFSQKPPHYLFTPLKKNISIFSFQWNKSNFPKKDLVSMVGTLENNTFNGMMSVRFIVKSVH